MNLCEKCGKELHLIECFRHPVLGDQCFLCSDCFDKVYESFNKWRDANQPYIDFFKKK